MALLDPNKIIVGENVILNDGETFESMLATRCIHNFGPWHMFARGSRRFCLDCNGGEVFTPRHRTGIRSQTTWFEPGEYKDG